MVVLCCAVLAREEIQATYTTRWNGLGEAERPRWWRWGGWRWRMGGYVIGLCRALSSVDDNNNIVVAFCSALCYLYYILYTRESQLWVQKKMWDNIHNYTTVSLHYSAATNEPLPVKVIRLLSSFTLWAWAELRTGWRGMDDIFTNLLRFVILIVVWSAVWSFVFLVSSRSRI